MSRTFVRFCCLLCLSCGALFAQSAETPAAFEAADVHVSAVVRNPFMNGPLVRPGRYEIRKGTMLDLISTAYGIDGDDVWGGPSWLEMDRFDIIAKTPGKPTPDELKTMLQALLADRFKLTIHKDNKPMPAFALTAGKKVQLKRAEETTDPGRCNYAVQDANGGPAGPTTTTAVLIATCKNMTAKAFADGIRNMPMADRYLNRLAVVDQTGLDGAWDIVLKYSLPGRPGGSPSDTITLQEAIEKQLGLKVEAIKIPLPVVIVDSVNQTPTANPANLAEVLGSTAPPTEFELAVLKPSSPEMGAKDMRFNIQPGGKVNLQAVPLKFLIQQMWQINPDMIVNAPKWMDEDRYDLVAKAPAAALSTATNGPPIDFEALLGMVKNLLADRFKLVTHIEDRPMNAYTLVAAKPKMKKADPASRTRFKEGPAAASEAKNDPRNKTPILGRLVSVQNMTMAQFAAQLQNIAPGYIFSPVQDATGLEGTYDFTLSFSPAGALQGGGGGGGRGGAGGGDAPPPPGAASGDTQTAADPSGAVSLFEAVERQLGLKLEMRKRPVPMLVIDSVERKPTEN